MKQYNVAYAKVLPDGRVFTPTIGRAFESESGKIIDIRLDALPLPQYWKRRNAPAFPGAQRQTLKPRCALKCATD